ncbi:MAG: septal ring lytic transglycosylase RlpA family protein [Lysobacter sp.]|nr:septal ring lytic transglycosylase RlpA family protein [Lysobacter sp.]
MIKRLLAASLLSGLVACAGAPKKTPAAPSAPVTAGAPTSTVQPLRKASPYAPAQEDPNTRGHYTAGGLYRPGVPDSTPDYVPDVALIPEPEVVAEPRSKVGNRASYSVLGKQYHLLDRPEGYAEQGLASYYGSKFHGRRTSNLEVYDMNAFTAAHKTLPLPSFARVTNLENGKSVVVRVNDRGPFHDGRIVDLSYAAAVKLGITRRGTGKVEVRALTPGSDAPAYAAAAPAPSVAASTPERSSTLDSLLATLPIASASAFELPPGVRIATGKPARLDVPPTAAAARPSDARNDAAASADPGPTPAAAPDRRFDMHQNGRTMTADEFDQWMKTRQVSVATGAARAIGAATTTVPETVASASVQILEAPTTAARAGGATTLQVASFSARANADRALTVLHDAGIAAARLLMGSVDGREVWRLRVGPLEPDTATQLSARIAELGFGPPQRVRD